MKIHSRKNLFSGFFMLSVALFSFPASGEIEKHAIFCETIEPDIEKICFKWFPKLPKVKGWHQEKEYSLKHAINAQTPDGNSFTDAETVIYGKALYKNITPKISLMQEIINNNNQVFKDKNPKIRINEREGITSNSGMMFRIFEYTPENKGNWERVSFAEEKDKEGNEYFILISISSRTQDGLKNSLRDYEEFIRNYK